MRDMVDNARKIVLAVQIPVFADADTGYGDAIQYALHRAGIHSGRASLAPTLKTRRFRRNPAPAAAVSRFRRWSEGTVKLAESKLGGDGLVGLNGRDEDASRLDLRRPSLPS